MTMTPLHSTALADVEPTSAVTVEEDAIILNNFREMDLRVHEAVGGTEDPEGMVHRILELGARCVSDTSTLLQTQMMTTEVDRLTSEIGASVTAGAKAIAETATALLGEDGALPLTLTTFRDDLAELLEGTFDDDSKTSVLAKFDSLLAEHQKRVQESIDAQLDLNKPGSPLALSRETILKKVEEEGGRVIRRLEELAKDLAVKKARMDEGERGTRKGRAYEEIVYASVQERVNSVGDVAEHVGDEFGAVTGSKVGDVVVGINPKDAAGHSIRYVLEAKDKNIGSLRKMLEELDEALENREAVVAVGVFSSQENAPIRTALETFASGTKVLVVAEKDEEGDLTPDGWMALRLACSYARLMSLGTLHADADDMFDVKVVDDAVTRARSGLANAKAVRSAHSKARKGIEEAGDHLTSLCGDVEEALALIEAEIRRRSAEIR